jgi:hypothetical protein
VRDIPVLTPGRFFGAIENGERGAQLYGSGDGVVLEEAVQAREGEGFELAHLVAEAFVSITADLFDGLFDSSSTLCEAKWPQLVEATQGDTFQREILVSRHIANSR